MKKLLLSLLSVGAAACQPHAADPASTNSKPAAPASKLGAAATPATEAPGPNLPAADAVLVQQYDLSELWRGSPPENGSPAMDGFFGSAHERIGFVFSKIWRDPQQPTLYHVEGKDRFHKLVTAFHGTIQATSCRLLDSRQLVADGSILELEASSKLYATTATFDFQEYPRTSAAGRFSGTAHLDFVLNNTDKPELVITMNERIAIPSLGAGLLYQGQWTGYAKHTVKPLQLAYNVFVIAPAELANFTVGDRDPTFNPKYAKLGWNDYWANDEWWNDSPKPALSL